MTSTIRVIRAAMRSLRRRPADRMPTVAEFKAMGPARAREWHRLSGVEAKVAAAIAESGSDREGDME